MNNINEFTTNYLKEAIVEINGTEINYGRLRSFSTESGLKFVADLTAYGDLVESFGIDSMAMGEFDGVANLALRLEVGDGEEVGSFIVYPSDNEQVARLSRIFSQITGMDVSIVAAYHGIVLEVRGNGDDTATMVELPDLSEEELEAITWPRETMDYDKACELLAKCTRHELRDHAFNDRELTWVDGFGHLVALGGAGSSGYSVQMVGFEEEFTESQARTMIDLGTLGEIERNDETGPDEYIGA